MTSELALKIAQVIHEEYSVGTASRFCDEPADWDEADDDELAELIDSVLQGQRVPEASE